MRKDRPAIGRLRGGVVVAYLCAVVATMGAAEPADPPATATKEPISYTGQIKPLLRERCYACHGALKQKGGLRLDTADLALKGGDSGPAVVKGAPGKSPLVDRVTAKDIAERMPPEHEGEALTTTQVSLLREWIAAGAIHPATEQPEADPRDHWAFRPVIRPAVPSVRAAQWTKNPIDAFVAKRHEEFGLTPQPEASRAVLLRRLSLDLIGLPPTPQEIAAFQADRGDGWYERAVDRLLADPRYGERWGRHWMDIWRYSDWWGLGDQLRNSQKHLWHWRDWLIESLNSDLPYDEMVRQMLAADELYPDDPQKLRATGFLARNYFLFNRSQWMDQTVEHVGKGFLGLTMNCVRCHDHKYDPFPQADYYRFRAFFEPYHARMDLTPGETDLERDGLPRVFDAWPDEPTYRYIRGDEKSPDKSKVIPPGVPAMLSPDLPPIKPVELPAGAWQPQRQPWVVDAHIAAAKQKLSTAEATLAEVTNKLSAAESIARKIPAPTTAPTAPQTQPSTPELTIARVDRPIVDERFATLDRSRWHLIGGEWAHTANRLEQKQDGAQRAALRLRDKPPRDFDATVRFTILGGSRWRSVGIGFDAADVDPTQDSLGKYHEQHVYASGVRPGSKVQFSYNQSGKWQYPPAPAARLMPVASNREHTLRVQVRDTLINVSLDGEPAIACTTPVPRVDGLLHITTFDALVAFHEVRIEPLDPKVQLRPASGIAGTAMPAAQPSPATDVEGARADQAVATAAVAVARTELAAVEQRAAAWRAIWNDADPGVKESTRTMAIRAERAAASAKARHALSIAERDLQRGGKDKSAAEKAVKAARDAVEKSMSAVSAEIKSSDKPAEFVGARWTPTRFFNSGKDDPAPTFGPKSTGRRTALAAWITDRRNPLTARVAVNHLWTRHFGTPLVPTVFDFGRKGQPPTHPELLDWLASELVESGWSMKHVHRLIVTSTTYRMSSSTADAEANIAKDADNVHLWRRTPGRLESQAVRDSLLSLAGALDATRGGPSVPPAQQADSKRRSIYFFHSNNDRNLFLTTFDEALVTDCYRREQSIVPQQALALTNSRLVLDLSRPIADRIADHLKAQGRPLDSDQAFIREAFLLLLAAEPSEKELAACARSLDAWRKLPDAGKADAGTSFARANLVWALLNHNDFVTIR